MKVTYPMVLAAAQRIRSSVYTTPLLTSAYVDAAVGVNCYFKAEHLQRTGSFKMRGAANAVFSATDEDAARGFVAHSAGNHGAALAAASEARGVPCTIVVPSDTPVAKVRNIERYGATCVLCEPNQKARAEGAASEAARMGGATIVPPYDDPSVVAGQGTIALELIEQAPELDAILVPTSGGGMLSGIALAARALKPGIRVIAVEPEGKELGRAFAEGKRVLDEEKANRLLPTIADAIRTTALGPGCWELAQQHVDPVVLSVSNPMLREAVRARAPSWPYPLARFARAPRRLTSRPLRVAAAHLARGDEAGGRASRRDRPRRAALARLPGAQGRRQGGGRAAALRRRHQLRRQRRRRAAAAAHRAAGGVRSAWVWQVYLRNGR